MFKIQYESNFCAAIIQGPITLIFMKYRNILFTISAFTLLFISSVTGQNVGINTASPEATLDVNGDIILRPGTLSLVNMSEQVLDVNSNKYSYYRVSGPTADFAISGITEGVDGRMLTLFNQSGFNMVLNAQDQDADPSDRIITATGEDLTVPDRTMVNLIYDGGETRWIIKSTGAGGGGLSMGWDTSGMNIFYENNVGIGTSDPISPLTIQTGTNETGLTQIGGVDSITIATKINDSSASIGTSSNHMLSLSAGGNDLFHLWPDGRVVIGTDADPQNLLGMDHHSRTLPPEAKLTLETPLSNSGWVHVGGDNEIVVDESIGNVSASIGTLSDNTFRLKTAGQGRLHIQPDGKIWIGANSQVAISPLTVYSNDNDYGITLLGQSSQLVGMRLGGAGGSATIGTYSPHNFRLVCNSNTALSIAATSLNVGIGVDFAPEKLTVQTAPNNFGFSHRSDGGIILASHIGVVSASFGTVSNNKFRLVANNASVMTIHPNGNVGIGMDDPLNKLEVNGTIRSKEIIVETANWPDYVFSDDYKMYSLNELEKFISENHHLPNMPSADMIEENGQHLGELQRKMMEKIEELSLLIIELNKRIEAVEQSKK
jgi:hypothetical protein